MSAEPPPDLKLSSLLNLDGLESVLSTVTSNVDALRATVHRLQQRLDDAVTSPEFIDFSSRASALLEDMKRKLSSIEQAIAVPPSPDPSSTSIGSIVHAHQLRLSQLTSTVEKKAAVEDVNGACEAIMAELSAFRSKSSVESASTMDIAAIMKTQEQQHQHIAALEGMLSAKMDKLEASRVRSAADKISHFASTYAATEQRIADIIDAADSADRRQQEMEAALEGLKEENARLKEAVEGRARGDAVEALGERLCSVEKAAANASSKADARKLGKTQDLISETLGELSRSLVEHKKASRRAQEAVAGRLGAVVEKEGLDAEMKKSEVMIDLAQTARDLEKEVALCKSEQADLAEEVAALKEEKKRLQSKVELSVRFIEWFSDREDAIEIKQRLAQNTSPTRTHHRRPFYPISPNTNTSNDRASSAAKRLASIRGDQSRG